VAGSSIRRTPKTTAFSFLTWIKKKTAHTLPSCCHEQQPNQKQNKNQSHSFSNHTTLHFFSVQAPSNLTCIHSTIFLPFRKPTAAGQQKRIGLTWLGHFIKQAVKLQRGEDFGTIQNSITCCPISKGDHDSRPFIFFLS
jgi:hypothetical protein